MECRYKDCTNCPLPACVYDGFDPTKNENNIKYQSGEWTEEEIEKFKRLLDLDYSVSTMSNIFRRKKEDILEMANKIIEEE